MRVKLSFVSLAAVVLALAGCSQRTAVTGKLDERLVRVGISASAWPKSVVSSTDFVIAATVVNAGQVSLPSLGKDNGDRFRVGVSYHWRELDDKVVVWDGIFNPLTADLKKGDVQHLDLAILAPPKPGRYVLELDMLQNGAFWFGANSQTARLTVQVN